jgi:hypothetical protein
MAKESCRYALSWDIFGGPDSVTLTLTWKLIDEETQSSIINESSSTIKSPQSTYDNPRSTVKTSHPSASPPRRSRRDETLSQNENASVPAIFRSSRGKSLEGSNKQTACQHQHSKDHQHVSSLERSTIANHYHHRSKKGQQQQQPPPPPPQKPISAQSDQTYGSLYDTRSSSVVKCATISSLSSSSPSPQPNNNPPLSIAHTHHQRAKQQQQSVTPPTARKTLRSLVNTSRTPTFPVATTSNYTPLRRTNHIARHNDDDDDDDDDDALDPWVKRFECSLEDNEDETFEHSERKESLPITPIPDSLNESGNTSGKVKFKTKPDYF